MLDKIKKITNKDFKFYELDYSNKEKMDKVFAENKIDSVIHFAGYKAVGESVEKPIEYYTNIDETIKNVDAVLIMTEWPQIKEYDLTKYEKLMKEPLVLDGRNCYSLKDAEKKALELAKEKVLLSIDEKDEILTEKVLQKSINDSIMNIDIFITTKENIATLS